MFYVDARLEAAAAIEVPAEHARRAAYVVQGEVDMQGANHPEGTLLVFDEGEEAGMKALRPSRVALLGGAPLDGVRHIWWNFVASSQARIERAGRDWAEGRFAPVPGETEFIPLPPS
jgi:redox-sensitive bicupin YhaK (pirin superfamily)